jgi:GGDEF domain-containing protein
VPGTRGELLDALEAAIRTLAPGRAVLLLALDVSDFRRYNAEHGYAAGDTLLDGLGRRPAALDGLAFTLGADAVAPVLEGMPEEFWRRGAAAAVQRAHAVRHDDAVFRMGGDEFALLLERCPRERALEVVDRVLERLRAGRAAGDLPVGASFGVAVADCSDPVDSDDLLRRADDAMYDAKGSRAILRVAPERAAAAERTRARSGGSRFTSLAPRGPVAQLVRAADS